MRSSSATARPAQVRLSEGDRDLVKALRTLIPEPTQRKVRAA